MGTWEWTPIISSIITKQFEAKQFRMHFHPPSPKTIHLEIGIRKNSFNRLGVLGG